MSDETIFPKGMMIKKRKEGSSPLPSYVKAEFSFKCDEFAEFMNDHQSNGWITIVMKESKAGNVYLALDTWKPTQGDHAKSGMAQARQAVQEPEPYQDTDIPF